MDDPPYGSRNGVYQELTRLHQDIERLVTHRVRITQASIRQQYLDGTIPEDLYRQTETLLGKWDEDNSNTNRQSPPRRT